MKKETLTKKEQAIRAIQAYQQSILDDWFEPALGELHEKICRIQKKNELENMLQQDEKKRLEIIDIASVTYCQARKHTKKPITVEKLEKEMKRLKTNSREFLYLEAECFEEVSQVKMAIEEYHKTIDVLQILLR